MTHLQSSEMNHIINVGVRVEDLIELLLIPDVELDELRSFPAYQFYAIQNFGRRIVEVVGNDDFVAMFEKRKSCE